MTSLAIADGIVRRLRAADKAAKLAPVPFRVGVRDVGLALVVISGIVIAFTGTHRRPVRAPERETPRRSPAP